MTALSLEDQVIVALRRITRAIDLHSRGLMQGCGLTAPQLAALKAVGRLQPVTVGALAKSIHLSQATLTGIVTRLENRSLISRSRSGTDRRTVVVELTAEGSAVLETAPSLLRDRFRLELLKLKQWEQTQMLATLQRIAAMMDAEEFEALPAGLSELLPQSSASGGNGATTGAEVAEKMPASPEAAQSGDEPLS